MAISLHGDAINTDRLKAALSSYHPNPDMDLVDRAFEYADEHHREQFRKSGEPYITHPLAVAEILAELKLDEASICTGLLHDTVEDTDATTEELATIFGTDVSLLVDGVTKLAQIEFSTREEKMAENFRKMLVAMAKDIRVLLVKLADRLHNMRTMASMREDKQLRIASETLDIYAPLANRLGIGWLKMELEDLSFRYKEPEAYRHLADKLGQTRSEREGFIESVTERLQRELSERGVENFTVSGRPKHFFSIYKKMVAKKIPFEEVHDLIAFRIITDSVRSCYEIFGYIHEIWRPVMRRVKDYIGMPKPNGYRSLHTTVIGPQAHRIEIQIRTDFMHHVAEDGIAAHWKYKESGGSTERAEVDGEGFAWLRQLMDWQRELEDPTDFLDSVRFDLFVDEVFVFTPNGDVFELPRGATPIDFAFSIHSDVGMRCSGAKVNGRIVPLRYRFKSGDTCEIITSKNQKPNKAWLEFVKSSKARTKIRAYLRKVERERSREIGLELVDREMRRFGLSLQKTLKDVGTLAAQFKEGKYPSDDDVLSAVGYGRLNPQQVVEGLIPEEARAQSNERSTETTKESGTLNKIFENVSKRSTSAVKLEGIENILVHYARCCSPIKGDDIVGFVSRGRGLVVHRSDCDRVLTLEPERRIHVTWDAETDVQNAVTLRVITSDRPGMLSDLTGAFSKNGVNIQQADCRVLKEGHAVNTFVCGIRNTAQVRQLEKALLGIDGVFEVRREGRA